MYPKNLATAHFAVGESKTVYTAPSGVGAKVVITICATDPVAPILAHVKIAGHYVARALRTDYAQEPISLAHSLNNGAMIEVKIENATADVYIDGEEYTLGSCETTADDVRIELKKMIKFVHDDLTAKLVFCAVGASSSDSSGSVGGSVLYLDRAAEDLFLSSGAYRIVPLDSSGSVLYLDRTAENFFLYGGV